MILDPNDVREIATAVGIAFAFILAVSIIAIAAMPNGRN